MTKTPNSRAPLKVREAMNSLAVGQSKHLWEGETLWVIARTKAEFVCVQVASSVDWEPLVLVQQYPLLKIHQEKPNAQSNP